MYRLRIRSSRNLLCVLAVVLVMSNIGCQKKVGAHPNQINSFDGQTYDTLVSAQAALDEAKNQYAQGKLTAVPNAKLIINTAGASYETTRTAWMTWRDITLGVKSGDAAASQTVLETDMAQLAVAVANVVKLTSGGK
jgi:predicted lipoprotein